MDKTAKRSDATVAACALLLLASDAAVARGGADEIGAIDSLRNNAFVVANMTADFRTFGLCPQQAEMLADQTATFGTLGMLTTMAAVGIGAQQAARGRLPCAPATAARWMQR